MVLTNAQLINAKTVLERMQTEKLSIKTRFNISKNIINLSDNLRAYEEQKHRNLLALAEKDKNGNLKADDNGQAVFTKTNQDKWSKSYEELLKMENDIKDIKKIKINELENSNITAQELVFIDFMLEE